MELPMIRDVCYTKGWYGLALFSDMHIGATDIDEKRLRDDLKTACDEGRRILINGDLTESIFPSDRKRYTPSRAMSSRDDVINEIMYYTVELLTPYVDYIDLIGTGNHDDAPIKYSGFDIVGAVCTLLNTKRSEGLGNIHRAGYWGYARYSIGDNLPSRRTHLSCFDIYHHHGSGGNSPVTKGMIDFNRVVYSHNADLYWLAHKHVGTIDPYIMRDGISRNGLYEHRRCQAVFTPGYKNAVSEPRKDGGYNYSYSDHFYNMQGCGYAVVNLYQDRKSKLLKRDFEVIPR